MLSGITVRDWLRLLRENGFEIDLSCWPRGAVVAAASVFNSMGAVMERMLLGSSHPPASQPPLFILGHWRSGTTHLHNLLACDEQFIAPTLYQVLFPHTFRLTEKLVARVLSALLAGRREFDNVQVAFNLPNEDEFATCLLSARSPYMSLAFPRRRAHYRRFLTFQDASREDISSWQSALATFVGKFTLGTGRQPLLKSPPHTGRIGLLLEIFPDARFLHVHRHPYAVFQSRREQILGKHVQHHLQVACENDVEEETIAVYREMHEAFFRERALIPAGHCYELDYDDLVREPVGQLRAAYDALALDGFERMEAHVRQYLGSTAGYARNVYPEISDAMRQRLTSEWRLSFEQWGYES